MLRNDLNTTFTVSYVAQLDKWAVCFQANRLTFYSHHEDAQKFAEKLMSRTRDVIEDEVRKKQLADVEKSKSPESLAMLAAVRAVIKQEGFGTRLTSEFVSADVACENTEQGDPDVPQARKPATREPPTHGVLSRVLESAFLKRLRLTGIRIVKS